jgi:esterase
MKLHYREYGTYTGQRPTLIFLHGLLGSSSNWHSVARQLEADYHIIVPDLRNHGRSPRSHRIDYPLMTRDLVELIEEHGLDLVLLVGHSMGGKVAMWLALEKPDLVQALVVVDIAPVSYPNRFDTIFSALQKLDLGRLGNRGEAEVRLGACLEDPGLRQYLLQSLARGEKGWFWRINLEVLVQDLDNILSFPPIPAGRAYLGPGLFIYGTESDYVTAATRTEIQQFFPYARLRAVSGAGHWVYSDQPEAFLSALSRFLASDSLLVKPMPR